MGEAGGSGQDLCSGEGADVKVTLESTSKIVEVNGVPCRIWEGHTESGIAVHAFITRIGCPKDADGSEFERELQICRPPSADVQAYPARIIL